MADEINVDQKVAENNPPAQGPISEENPVLVSPQEPTTNAPIPQTSSTPADVPSVAPEGSGEAVTTVPVEDQNGAVNQAESGGAPAPLESAVAQAQPLAQQDKAGLIHDLLVKAQAKIQSNKQKKLDKLAEFAQKKGIITNDDVQKLLRVSDATATRYLVKLVEQGRLTRVGSPRDAKYQFLG